MQLAEREKKLLSALLTLRAETAGLIGNQCRWHNSERHKAERQADKIIREFTK